MSRPPSGTHNTSTIASMPHATDGEVMADEDSAIQQFLAGEGEGFSVDQNYTHEFDQKDKAEDAIDYEDLSDEDDLPEEELPSGVRVDEDGDVDLAEGGDLFSQISALGDDL